jgi:3-oxoacyl-(acyl-carrier-protein) synthase
MHTLACLACVRTLHTPVLTRATCECLLALCSQLHPNPNLKNPDPAVDLNIVVGATAQKHPVRRQLLLCTAARFMVPCRLWCLTRLLCRLQVDVALSNSFGFGGHNSCILFAGFKE